MANPFLNSDCRDVETAIMLEQALVHDIGNANTDDNLFKILPAYDHNMLKWLLWHERFHKELRHHDRFFKYLEELDEEKTRDEFHLSKQEVNIIMDILVHDSLSKMFPELVETAAQNLAQLRNRNSLGYTFKTHTLEKMLNEYKVHKTGDDGKGKEEETKEGEGEGKGVAKPSDKPSEDRTDKDEKSEKADTGSKGHAEGGKSSSGKKDKPEDEKPEVNKDAEVPPPDEHDKTDWKKLESLDDKEFISEGEGDRYEDAINRLKHKKFKLGKLTETLNGLVTTTRERTYAMPSYIKAGKGIILKGRRPGRASLYLCFDASGSMSGEMNMFKEIISKSIPQAMTTPTTWFSGDGERIAPDPEGRSRDYYKGTFKDFMPVEANSGYSDDGDRTIELCWRAEQQGYSPIGITDGGGQISWATDMLKELKRTIFVGQNPDWLEAAKNINPKIQILDI